jgi:hypothetical protein
MMLAATKPGVTWMPRKRPPFVELWRDRHGKIRVYFRKDRGPRLPLPNTIGSDEFNAAYQAALLAQPARVQDHFVPDAPGTIAALVASYMKSAAYVSLRETTKDWVRESTRSIADRAWPSFGLGAYSREDRDRDLAALHRSTRRSSVDLEDAARPHSSRNELG